LLFFRANVIVGPDFFMRNPKLLLLLLLIAALFPYLVACFYAMPFADDFCFGWTASEKISFVQKFLKQYLNWNGRYTSDVLVNLHPLTTGSLFLYQLVSFVSIVATPLAFFVFIRQWVNNSPAAIIAALFISLFYLSYQPNITEGVYWYIGLVNYHWGSLCFILQLAVLITLLKAERDNIFLFFLSLLFLIIAIGFNEIAAALIPAYYLAMLIYANATVTQQPGKSRWLRILFFHFVVAVIASAFVVCSPGNFTRENAFPARFNLLHSVVFAGLQTIRFIGHWAMSIPFVALSLLVMVNIDKVKVEALKEVHAGVWVSLLLFTVFIAALIPYLATGILGQHRTMNYVFPFFIILWVGVLISLSSHYRIAEEAIPETTGIRALILAVVALVIMSATGNSGKILQDLYSGIFPKYKVEFMARQATVLTQPALAVQPLQNMPRTFQVVDTKGDTSWWGDKCMKHFYTETNIVLH
jgi:hypothetical protein